MNAVDRARSGEAPGFHAWRNDEESRRFKDAFCKVLVRAVMRGDGDLGVYRDGQIVWYSRRE